MSRARIFTFTRNNPGDNHAEDTTDCKYMVYGKEVGESGTPHRQGTIQFKNAKSEEAVRKILIGCHVEICKDFAASIAYCKKDGNFFERGVAPLTAKKKGEKEVDRWDNLKKVAREGPDAWETLSGEDYVKYDKFLEREYDRMSKKRQFETMNYSDSETPHIWCYGETGTGKSRQYHEEYPDAYLKMCNKWWDGYEMEPTVLLEEISEKYEVLGHHIKKWADRYPFMAEKKGGALKIRPERIIVTSNYHPSEIWKDERDLGPIMRRFKVIHKTLPFPLSKKPKIPSANAPNFTPGQK